MTSRPLEPAEQIAWFHRTGHCGGCGQPAAYCMCNPARPCPCHHLHTVGGGREPDALLAFADPVLIDGQTELFGETS